MQYSLTLFCISFGSVMISRKYKACLWKNYRARRLSCFFTMLEIILPGVFFGLLVYIHYLDAKAASENQNAEFGGQLYNMTDLVKASFGVRKNIDIAFAPTNNFTIKVMESILTNVFIKHEIAHKIGQFVGMSKDVSVSTFLSSRYFNKDATETAEDVGYGFLFDERARDDITEAVLNYRILCTLSTIDTHGNFPETIEEDKGSRGQAYINAGIPVMQWYLEKGFIEMVYGDFVPFALELHSFPYPAVGNQIKSGKVFITILLPLFTMISFIFFIPGVIRRIVQEKSTGVKELMRIMGLNAWHLWSSWFVHSIVIFLITTSIVSVILTVKFTEYAPLLGHVNTIVVWLLFFLFCVASLIFCFAVSTVFNNGVAAMSCGVIVWIGSFTVLNPIVNSENTPYLLKVLVCLFPTGAVNTGFKIMYYYNNRSEKLTLSETVRKTSEFGISMILVYVMLLVDIVLFSLLTWYIDNIKPGTYGIAKRWNFLLLHFKEMKASKIKKPGIARDTFPEQGIYEKPLPYLKVGICVTNLRKVYASDVVGLDGISLNIYQGVITVLLGHNGAGKTSLMGIISGLHSPTSGNVLVGGKDIFDNMKHFHTETGICFQSNYLFTYLNVLEHFIFFGMVKGKSMRQARAQGIVMLKEFNMYEKRYSMIDKLSGGMMRRVSLAIALIGDPKVLLLDEPTSGMDPETRREVWDLILRKRGEHTIVVTTQFMEEADVLGDWIAIIDHGKVICYGTTPFLKQTYGTGYHLTISKEKRFKSEPITRIIRHHVPQGTLEGNHQSIVSYNLPEETSSKFGHMFSELEQNKDALGIVGIGIQCTTIEEVFLRVGESLQSTSFNFNQYILANFPKSTGFKDNLTGVHLMFQQFKALLVKKLVYDIRNLLILFIMTVVPVAIVIVTFPETMAMRNLNVQPPLKIALHKYGKTTVFSSSIPIPGYAEEYKAFMSSFQSVVEDESAEYVNTTDVVQALLHLGQRDFLKFRLRTIISTAFDRRTIRCYFSNLPNHAIPICINMVSNALLRYYFPKGSVGTTLTINPVDSSALEETCGQAKNRMGDTIGHQWAVSLPQCLLCIMTVFIMLPAVERSSGNRHLQLMAGVSPLLYWVSCFVWDYFLYVIVVVLLIMTVIFADSANHVFSTPEAIGIFLLILLLYGLSGTAYAYFASNFGATTSNIVGNYLVFSICFGLITAIGMNVAIIKGYDGDHVLPEDLLTLLKYTLPLCPHYCLVTAVISYGAGIFQNHLCRKCPDPEGRMCKEESLLVFNSKENRYGFLMPLAYLSVDWLIYLALILLTDYKVFHNLYWRLKDATMNTRFEGDSTLSSDVLKEKEKTLACSKNRQLDPRAIFMSVGLGKVYGKKSLRLQPMSFRVRKGECFGLLGTNGAGKSTAFKLLVGELKPTAGDAVCFNSTLTRDRRRYLSKIGYCPQWGALNYSFTGEEVLRLFAQLRGVHPRRVETEVDHWIRLLGLGEHRSLRVGAYSGGTQRKLSAAAALIGHPPVVFLDEPTAGVDPFGRRNLWAVLNASKELGQAVLLTSHSMRECEALCGRLTIVVGGRLECLGSVQYLKRKFGQGYTVAVVLRTAPELQAEVSALKEDVAKRFARVKLKDEHKKLLHYHVKDEDIQLSQLFDTMEELKQTYAVVESYMVGDTTLEQVFISFAKKHIKPEIIL